MVRSAAAVLAVLIIPSFAQAQEPQGTHTVVDGNTLWDLAQRSLLRRGELHNNVRMTWGKAFLPWAQRASWSPAVSGSRPAETMPRSIPLTPEST